MSQRTVPEHLMITIGGYALLFGFGVCWWLLAAGMSMVGFAFAYAGICLGWGIIIAVFRETRR